MPLLSRSRCRGRRVTVALALLIAACASTPTTATAQERATCTAVFDLGSIIDTLFSGRVPPGDEETVGSLVEVSNEVRAASWMAGNNGLARDGARLAVAAAALQGPDGDDFATSPEALMLALRSLLEQCESLGIDAGDAQDLPEQAVPTLTVADLPPGWEPRPHQDDRDRYATLAADYRRCMGTGRTLPWGPLLHGDDFVQGSGERQIRSAVMKVSSRDAAALVEQTTEAAAPTCMAEVFRQALSDNHTSFAVRALDTVAIDVGGRPGLRTTLQLTVNDAPVQVVIDDVFLAEGPWLGHVQLIGAFEPLADGGAVLDAFERRLAEA